MEDQKVEVTLVACEKIVPGRTVQNDRKEFNHAELLELADSIREHGLAQPITVRPIVDPERGAIYEVVAGERRYRAVAWILKWPTIPAIIRQMSDEQASAIMLVENVNRADLKPIEEAKAYRNRMEAYQWTERRVGEVVGKTVDHVRNMLKLLKVCEDFWPLINSGQLPLQHARELSRLGEDHQRAAIRIFSRSGGMAFAGFSAVVRQMAEADDQASLFALELFMTEEIDRHAGVVLGGKNAKVNVPTSTALPAVDYTMAMTTGEVIYDYIRKLEGEGHTSEAAAVGNLYKVLVHFNWAKLPRNLTAENAGK